jgi:hypothetical protein
MEVRGRNRSRFLCKRQCAECPLDAAASLFQYVDGRRVRNTEVWGESKCRAVYHGDTFGFE